ncbi:MAG: hypothetical protein ABIQ02_11840 [Saprospiraceae bacterium]
MNPDQLYRIKHSIDESIVGTASQIQTFSRTHPVLTKLYFSQNEEGFFENDMELPVYRMESKAKLTDLINTVPLSNNLVISPGSYQLFKKMKLPDYQVFPVKFIYKGQLNQDYLAFSIVKNPEFLKYISWEHSRFYKTLNYHRERVSEFVFRSMDEFLLHKKQFNDVGFGLSPDIKLNYQNDFDIINFGRYPMPLGFLCSEYAKNQILEENLTGFDFELLSSVLI